MRGAPPSVAIAGAGIAGLSAAIALKRAGFPVAVYEREGTLSPIGAGIQLGPNAARILEGWELDLLAHSSEPEAIELRSALSGALLASIPLRRAARARYGAPYVTLLRTHLQDALLSRARELGVEIKLGTPVTDLTQTKNGAAFIAGSKEAAADVLLGADGICSFVRSVLGPDLRPYPTHAVAWRALLPLGSVPAPMRDIVVNWMGPGAHLVHYPVSNGAFLNGVLVVDDGDLPEGESDTRAFLLRRLAAWAEGPRSAVASSGEWQPWPIRIVPKSEGGHGRVQLIGDAWHAMEPYLASGAVMAMEDGAEIAACLSEAEGAIDEALQRFRRRRGTRVWRVRDRSAQMGRLYHCPQPFDKLRDLALRAASGPMLLARNDWLYGPTALS